MGNIAVFGGTFNPFHIGHYEILKALCESEMFDTVLLIPDRIPPHKDVTYRVSDADRIEMCRIACAGFDKAKLCLIEFGREGKSYTVDTVTELKKLYPDDKIFVAIGADMLKTLDTWHNFDLLKSIAAFVAFNRSDDPDFSGEVERMRSLGADITVFDRRITNISSTEMREKVDPRFLPERVYDYVDKRGIYKRKNN